jgi:hypothetical protein
MVKPNIPNIPGMGAVTDTLDFVKNLWGGMGLPGVNIPGMNAGGLSIPGMGGAGMNIPGMVMPTLSVEEINKKISDLKAVEAWLTLNQNMLRGTIQALEVQAATITTLKTMGETFTASMKPSGSDRPEARTSATSSASSGTSSAASSSSHSAHTAKSFYSPNGNGSGNGASAAHSSSQANGNGNGSHAGRGQDEDADDDEPASRSATSAEPTAEDQQEAANLTAPLVNAAAWWNMLQDQFKQAVTSAMVPEPGKDGNAMSGSGSKEKAGGKPAARSAGAKTASKSAAAKPSTKSRAGSGSTSSGSTSSGGTTAKRKTSK